MVARLLRFFLRPIHRFLIRRTVVKDPWAVAPSFVLKHGQLAAGSTRPFSWYFQGVSTVTAGSVDEITKWLAECSYVRDMDLFHESDYWQHPTTFEQLRRGDCEDHALWAWRKLVELGFKAYFYIGRSQPDSGSSGQHAWVVFEREGTSYLLEPVDKDAASQIRPLDEVRTEYQPHYSVDSSYRVQAREGLLLYWREQELARIAKQKEPKQAA